MTDKAKFTTLIPTVDLPFSKKEKKRKVRCMLYLDYKFSLAFCCSQWQISIFDYSTELVSLSAP